MTLTFRIDRCRCEYRWPLIDGCQCITHTGLMSAVTVTAAAAPARAGLPLLDDGCCTVLVREPITASQADSLARILKALADPTRLRLVSMVAAHDGGEACVCD